MKYILSLIVFTFIFVSCSAQTQITCESAKDSIGKQVRICGEVSGTHFAANTKGHPTFINMCGAFPNALLTLVIWEDTKTKYALDTLKGKSICVSGTLTEYNGKVGIEIADQDQIQIK